MKLVGNWLVPVLATVVVLALMLLARRAHLEVRHGDDSLIFQYDAKERAVTTAEGPYHPGTGR